MARKMTNYDALAHSMDAVLNDESHKRIFERPNLKKTASAPEKKKEEKAKHPVHQVLEDIIAASTALDAMGLDKSAATVLKVADIIVAEANDEAPPMSAPPASTMEVAPGQDDSTTMPVPVGGVEPAPDEKPAPTPAAPMSAMDASHDAKTKEQKAEEKAEKARQVVQDLIDQQEEDDLSMEYVVPTEQTEIKPITVTPGT